MEIKITIENLMKEQIKIIIEHKKEISQYNWGIYFI